MEKERQRKGCGLILGAIYIYIFVLLYGGGTSLRSIARQMKADPKTIKKYCDRYRIPVTWKSKGNHTHQFENETLDNQEIYMDTIASAHASKIQNYILQNSTLCLSISEIREKFKKEYTWLYRHNKKLLKALLPEPRKPKCVTTRVCWANRDNEFFSRIQNEIEQLTFKNVSYRITLNRIGRKLGILTMLERYKSKLPRTCKLLEESLESVEEFQIRRVNTAFEELKQREEFVKEWMIYRKAGIKKNCSSTVKDEIRKLIYNTYIS